MPRNPTYENERARARRLSETPEQRAARRALHDEYNRRWRERNPDYWRIRYAAMTPEEQAVRRAQRHAAYARRRDAEPDKEAARARHAAAARARRDADPEDARAKARARYAADPERFRGYARRYGERNRERLQATQLVRYYDLTQDRYDAMFVAQGGLCAICQEPERAVLRGVVKRLCVDHDHETGRVRALLCARCNRAVGMMQDDPELLSLAAGYLTFHRGEVV